LTFIGATSNTIIEGGNTFNLYTGGVGSRIFVTATGNVGVNTNTPGNLLEVFAGASSRGFQVYGSSSPFIMVQATNNPVVLKVTADDVGGYLQVTTNHPLIFNTNNTERMRITSGGNVGIGTTTINSERLTVAQTTGNASALFVYTSGVATGQSYGLTLQAGTNSTDETFRVFNQAGNTSFFMVRGDGIVFAPPTYNNTTASGANVHIDTNGILFRSTSSLKYKTDVKDYNRGLAEVLKMRPVYYKGKSQSDGDTQFAGLIAEEIHELGLTEFVQYAKDGSPDALAYQNMVALLVKGMQEQQVQIEELKQLINK